MSLISCILQCEHLHWHPIGPSIPQLRLHVALVGFAPSLAQDSLVFVVKNQNRNMVRSVLPTTVLQNAYPAGYGHGYVYALGYGYDSCTCTGMCMCMRSGTGMGRCMRTGNGMGRCMRTGMGMCTRTGTYTGTYTHTDGVCVCICICVCV